jgi:hypothetical protein
MGLFGKAKPRRIVKEYGRERFLVLLNPVITAFVANMLRNKGRLPSEDRVDQAIEKDAIEMAKKGYRIASSEEFETPPVGIPPLRVAYQKVTYELLDPTGHESQDTN